MRERSVEYWRELVPDMHCCNDEGCEPEESRACDAARRAALAENGACTLAGDASDAALAASCGAAVEALAAANLPPAFVFVYDEAWTLARRYAARVAALMPRGAALNYDVYAWRVAPGDRGWAAHRDRAGSGVGPDGAPDYATGWVALTAAAADTACVWTARPNAGAGAGDPLALERLCRSAAAPLEVAAGDCAVWGGRTPHWGGRHAKAGAPPRTAMAFACSTPAMADDARRIAAVERWSPPRGALTTLDARLRLVALQLHFYSEAAPLDGAAAALLENLDAAWAYPDDEDGDADPPRKKRPRGRDLHVP